MRRSHFRGSCLLPCHRYASLTYVHGAACLQNLWLMEKMLLFASVFLIAKANQTESLCSVNSCGEMRPQEGANASSFFFTSAASQASSFCSEVAAAYYILIRFFFFLLVFYLMIRIQQAAFSLLTQMNVMFDVLFCQCSTQHKVNQIKCNQLRLIIPDVGHYSVCICRAAKSNCS